jgi:SAM-dependent methyltransferase
MACGHRSVSSFPDPNAVEAAYADAADPVSVREEKGQVATASRDLESIERWVARGTMVDLGCWTGSFCVASSQRGWRAVGVEPSKWGSERARQRGASVIQAGLDEADLPPGRFDLVVLCDVLEHLADPGAALRRIRQLLRPGGVLFLTVPDAGSVLARVLGRRWWSVLPMHLQYFTRESLRTVLEDHGFEVLDAATHAKSFTGRYYAERLGGYHPAIGRAAVRVVQAVGLADRLMAPDFRDRLAVVSRSLPDDRQRS